VPAPRRTWPVLQGVLPVRWSWVPADLLAGVTLAALAVPQAMGYAKIAGMPVVAGLYTLLLPMAAFALLGSSRHLVVAADSATAAILAAALAGMAAPASPDYVRLAGLTALLTGGLLLLAWVARLGFLANFLSGTVLVGFLAGLGIQVAAYQVPDMIGVPSTGRRPTDGLVPAAAEALPHARPQDLAVSAAVILVVLIAARITRRIPGPLIAVIGAIVVSRLADLGQHGVAETGPVPSGLPQVALPALGLHDVTSLLGTAASLFVVVLAQGAATSRAYAARHNETTSSDSDLVGLGAANVAAAFTSGFVVNGCATQTQMVDSAGGRSQLRRQLDRYGIRGVKGPDAYYDTPAEALEAYHVGSQR
jgi:SulP family sulfate permease